MGRKKSVLICTGNKDMSRLLEMRFLEFGYFSVIGATTEGDETLADIKAFYPDLFVVDTEIKRPDIDSLFFRLKEVSEYCRPKIFLLIPYTKGLSERAYRYYEFERHFIYPCDYDTIVEQAMDIFSREKTLAKQREIFERKALKLLEKENIPKHLSGATYIIEAAFLAFVSKGLSGAYALYADVAKKYKTKPASVERNIRTALSKCKTSAKKPTNLAFIYDLASKIEI